MNANDDLIATVLQNSRSLALPMLCTAMTDKRPDAIAGPGHQAGKRRNRGPRPGAVSTTAGKLSRFAPSEPQVRAVLSFVFGY